MWSVQPKLGVRSLEFNAARIKQWQPVTATLGADGDEAPQRVWMDQRG
jgi:hypothetical protein